VAAPSDSSQPTPWEEYEAADAGAEASRIGGYAGDEYLDPAERPLVEAGEGVAEGFELAEEDLISAAETGEAGADPGWDAFTTESEPSSGEYGEANHEDSSELPRSDR
jgi:hypothetical protein